MRSIKNNLWSHLSIVEEKPHLLTEVVKSDALEVKSFRELVEYMGFIAYKNSQFSLFFRGQRRDHRDKRGGSSVYPSIYRPSKGKNLKASELAGRLTTLRKAEDLLLERCGEYWRSEDLNKLKKFREIRWAILQHYEVAPTPLLDVTQSLRVACSFALNEAEDCGYVFVLGLPYLDGSISYSVYEQMLTIKLASICPPQALRPLFQEGYLLGEFPVLFEKHSHLNFARRLIAKFRLVKEDFWDDAFRAIPQEALYPDLHDASRVDELKKMCDRMRAELDTTRCGLV